MALKVHASRAHNGTARFSIWPEAASLTPLFKDITWQEAFRILAQHEHNLTTVEGTLRAALMEYDSEVMEG